MGSINPEQDQIGAMVATARERGPIHMLNLLRFRERAEYPADHPRAGENLSGREAYARYSKEAGPLFAGVGAHLAWTGAPDLVLIGPSDEQWDLAFVGVYPNVGAMLSMIANPDYQRAAINRTAALADSRLIRCAPLPEGALEH